MSYTVNASYRLAPSFLGQAATNGKCFISLDINDAEEKRWCRRSLLYLAAMLALAFIHF